MDEKDRSQGQALHQHDLRNVVVNNARRKAHNEELTTTMMVGRLPAFAALVFANYDKQWRPTEVLGGREGNQWRTSKAKAYPQKLSMVIAQAHLHHLGTIEMEGDEEAPEGLQHALSRLAQVHDPYDCTATGTKMLADYSVYNG